MNKKQPIIELVNLVKQYDNKIVLKNLNLKINKGEFLTLLGPSGSGKTTALRLIGGFEWPTRGEIKIYGRDVKDLPAYKRPTKTIFQDYALFPHLSVAGNIKYGLKLIRTKKESIQKKHINKLMELKKKWKLKSDIKMKNLDIEQLEYEKILSSNSKKSPKFKKAQKWLDSSDFIYSHWENYVQIQVNKFEKKHITRQLNKMEINDKTKSIIKLIGLEGYEKNSIDSISGGMKQRVALARSLVLSPEIILLDEPLSALDLKVRQKMQRELRALQQKLNMTFIFVTHDQEEAMTISDRVAVMRDGYIEQIGSPQEVYDFPKNKWVASFIGESNLFDSVVTQKHKIKIFNKLVYTNTNDFKKGDHVDIVIRPEDVKFNYKGYFEGKIVNRIYQGTMWEYSFKAKDVFWKIRSTKEKKIGEQLWITFIKDDVHLMKKGGKKWIK